MNSLDYAKECQIGLDKYSSIKTTGDDHSGVSGYGEGLSTYNTTLEVAIAVTEAEMEGRRVIAIPETINDSWKKNLPLARNNY